ncbi:MAG: Uma2 family endonuclease [Bacteroidetes bacterium]|nr:Uma2 family endonuclease [Bacteroidota bacterium]
MGNQLKGKGCRPLGSDMRLHIPKNTFYTYPDITVYCGDPELTDTHFDTATNPTVVIAILSPSTRNYDAGQKFMLYKEIPTLKDYILVHSEKIFVQHNIRNADSSWLQYDYKSIDDVFSIASIDVTLHLQTIYESVSF